MSPPIPVEPRRAGRSGPNERVVQILDLLSRRKRWVWGAIAALLPLAVLSAAGLEMDHRLEIWFRPSDPERKGYEQLETAFGNSETLIVVYQSPNLFSREELSWNRQLSTALSRIPYVAKVLSLTTVQVPRMGPFGPSPAKLVEDPIPDQTNLERLASSIRGKSILRDSLISADGTATGIVLSLAGRDPERNAAVVDSVRSLLRVPAFASRSCHLVGAVSILTEMYRVSTAESRRFVGICSMLVFLLIGGYFRSVRAALSALIVSLLTIVFTLALYRVAGHSLNMVAGILPLVLLVVSLSVSVHVIARMQGWQRGRAAHDDGDPEIGSRLQARAETYRADGSVGGQLLPILGPCFFSSLTTACAFWSFVFSPVVPLRDFGSFCGIGVLLSFLLCFALVPGILTAGGRSDPNLPRGRRAVKMSRVVRTVVAARSLRRTTWAICAAVFTASVFGVYRLGFETDQLDYLKASNPVRQDNELALNWFAGAYSLDVVLDLPYRVEERPAELLELLERTEPRIAALPEVVVVHSAASAVRDFIAPGPFRSQALGAMAEAARAGSEPARTGAPGAGALNGQMGFLSAEPMTRISVRTPKLTEPEMDLLLARIDESIREPMEAAGVTYRLTGAIPMYMAINRHLTESQIRSFLASFAVILLLLGMLFRDLRIAVVGMIPNVLPVLTTVGIMGLAGVSMDVATVLIAAISLGIAVDDSVHLLWSYRDVRPRVDSRTTAVQEAVARVGQPIVLTTLILSAGFLVLVLSSYLPLVYLGLFFSLNVLLALAYDLLLLPTLLPTGTQGSGRQDPGGDPTAPFVLSSPEARR